MHVAEQYISYFILGFFDHVQQHKITKPQRSNSYFSYHKYITLLKVFLHQIHPQEYRHAYCVMTFPVSSGVRVTRSLALYECFVDRCLSFRPFGNCVFGSSSILRLKRKLTSRVQKDDIINKRLFLKLRIANIGLNIDSEKEF
jgi:hypothetical protein